MIQSESTVLYKNNTISTEKLYCFDIILVVVQIIQFDNVISNIGSGYNEDKGVFTARIPGYYQFTVHAHTVVNKQAEVRVMVNVKVNCV